MARRIRSLMFGGNKGKDGVVWHRDHRSKKNRTHKLPGTFIHKTKLIDQHDRESEHEIKKAKDIARRKGLL